MTEDAIRLLLRLRDKIAGRSHGDADGDATEVMDTPEKNRWILRALDRAGVKPRNRRIL